MIDIAIRNDLELISGVPVFYLIAPESAVDNFIVITPLSNQFNAQMDPVPRVTFQVSIYNKSVMNGRLLQQKIFDHFHCFSGDITETKTKTVYRVISVDLTERTPIFEKDTQLYQFITDISLTMNNIK